MRNDELHSRLSPLAVIRAGAEQAGREWGCRLIRELDTQEVDGCDSRTAEPLLMALVACDGIPLYEAEPTEFGRFASLAMRRCRARLARGTGRR